jgi:hypothetical protein
MSSDRRALVRFAWLPLVTASLVACAGSLEDPALFLSAAASTSQADAGAAVANGGASAGEGEGGVNCPDVPQAIFAVTCTASTCHSHMNQAQGLDLQSPNIASRLIRVASTEGPGLLIDPSAPSNSVLYTKLAPTPPFGVRMPDGLPPLDDGEIACVLAWIQQVSEAPSPADSGAGDANAPNVGGE